jgi:hypothetical protein
MNRLADGVFDHSTSLCSLEPSEHGSTHAASAFNIKRKGRMPWNCRPIHVSSSSVLLVNFATL